MSPLADVTDLFVRFHRGTRAHTAVDGVSFGVERGETFGLTGPSGCGKSTILRVLGGLQRDWSGSLRLLGQSVEPGQRFKGVLRRDVQMVFQDPYGALHPNHTIGRALSEPLAVSRETADRRRIAAALGEVGLDAAVAGRYPHQISGGQRQRVCIARALLTRPKLLLLDEPTSALDTTVQAEILNLLNELKVAHGMTFVLVSHDTGVIEHMCDHAVRMNAGRIVRDA